jgi:hypothetical protein
MTEDDEVAELGSRLKTAVMLHKHHYFTQLTSETFYTTVMADHSQRSLMVLFYVKCR